MNGKAKINSKRKGAVGERELAKELTERGFPARRGVQYQGSIDSPDLVCEGLSGLHFECKRRKRGTIYEFYEQATKDAGSKVPVVAFRADHKPWLFIVSLEDFLKVVDISKCT